MRQDLADALGAEHRERRHLSELGHRLEGERERRGIDRVCEEAVESGLIHLEQLGVVNRSHRGGPRRRLDESELAERLATRDGTQNDGVPGVGILFLDVERSSTHHVERRGSVTLSEDGFSGAQRHESHAAGEVGKDILGQLVERRERVDHLGGLDPPGRLEPELQPPPEAA